MNEIQKQEYNMLLEIKKVIDSRLYSLAYGTMLGSVREGGFIDWDNDVDIFVKQKDYIHVITQLREKLPDEYTVSWIDKPTSYERFFARVHPKNKSHFDVHIDIFPLVGTPNNKYLRKIFFYKNYLVHRLFFQKKRTGYNIKGRTKKKLFKIVNMILKLIPEKWLVNFYMRQLEKYPISDSNEYISICGSCYYTFEKKFMEQYVLLKFENDLFPIYKNYHEILTEVYGDYLTPKKDDYLR